jgi:hypothetical protein
MYRMVPDRNATAASPTDSPLGGVKFGEEYLCVLKELIADEGLKVGIRCNSEDRQSLGSKKLQLE